VTLQNRVDPWGVIVATPERGTMLGNRGGKFHRDDRTLGKRRWASHHWIACELHYKNMRHEAMGQGYTSLFFLDEVTALSAGHRPCFFCRRAEAKDFLGDVRVEGFDRQLHSERVGPKPEVAAAGLPDGAMIEIGGAAFAVLGRNLLRWSFGGYTEITHRNGSMRGRLLTAPSITAILNRGYKPRWHESASNGDGT
jgi:hypothetical protein